jgi:hypothetical protein
VALHFACWFDQYESVDWLIGKGTALNVLDIVSFMDFEWILMLMLEKARILALMLGSLERKRKYCAEVIGSECFGVEGL